MDGEDERLPHSSHWGAFTVSRRGDRIEIEPHPDDPDPTPLLNNIPGAQSHRARILRPAVRRGWLERGAASGAGRGTEPFVQVSWDEAERLVADELQRVSRERGPEAIFGGSYGWSSAGRFHHAQSQVHRFLNTAVGGYTKSVNTYSAGASAVILPHVVGPLNDVFRREATWLEIAEDSELIIAFGGLPLKNSRVSAGGISQHVARGSLQAAARRGAAFYLVSPLEDDLPADLSATWLPVRPNTDVALMLGLAHTLYTEGRHDQRFIDRYCVGFERFVPYLTGEADGVPKDCDWAAAICGIPADTIRTLAELAAGRRTLITMSHSLQRAEFGEQPVWMALTLAAMIGQIGRSGGGFSYSIGAIGNVGKPALDVPIPTLPQGRNGVATYIPVARIADLLLHPGEPFDYNGHRLAYPDIRLVYWAGGNPFHHHQDINRLRRAFARPETIIVHDAFWTATARHADIVLPATLTMERQDIGAAANDPKLIAMKRVFDAAGEARDDFDIFASIAEKLGRRSAFTEDRTAGEWLAHLYESTREALADKGWNAPSFREFWQMGELQLPISDEPGMLRAFILDPVKRPLPTPSGRIEIFSERIDGFGYADCPGHPVWLEPAEWLGAPLASRFPLQLVANQPAGRLHSQLDFGATSLEGKVAGHEALRIHPADAVTRGIGDGDVVRVFNGRGACLAGAVVSEAVRPGVVQLPTGAWYVPEDPADPETMCLHGNPNVLTRDRGTSRLAQGTTGQLCLVEVEAYRGEAHGRDFYKAPGLSG
ncbi:MAG: molybdopterin-dependent oxidoreductase [Brucellaceae bacterium]|nr:molybdopterin-dependent oxidoreductase [Brucellaceae bacterium]